MRAEELQHASRVALDALRTVITVAEDLGEDADLAAVLEKVASTALDGAEAEQLVAALMTQLLLAMELLDPDDPAAAVDALALLPLDFKLGEER